jgi:hypothetical protein
MADRHDKLRNSKEKIDAYLLTQGMKWIEGEYKNTNSKLDVEDMDGYRYRFSLQHFYSNKGRAKVVLTNPHATHNLKLYLKLNKPTLELVSEKFLGIEEDHMFKCLSCGNIFESLITSIYISKKTVCKVCQPHKYTNEIIEHYISKNTNDMEVLVYYKKNDFWRFHLHCNKCGKEWHAPLKSIKENCGCPSCNKATNGRLYNPTIAERNKDKWSKIDAIVYVIRLSDDKEDFYKIGLTSRQTMDRAFEMPYKVDVLAEIKTNLYDACLIENQLHEHNKKSSYIPMKKFNGYTECFTHVRDLNNISFHHLRR